MTNKKFKRIEIMLLAIGFFIFLLSASGVIYSLNFLSSSMLYSFSSTEKAAPDTHFDIDGFNALGF